MGNAGNSWMSIRMKLLLSYAAMLVIPLVFMLATVLLLTYVFQGDLQNIRQTYSHNLSQFDHRHQERVNRELKRTLLANPELATQTDYVEELDQELQNSRSGLIVRLNDSITFVPERFNMTELLNRLPSYESNGYYEEDIKEQIGNQLYALAQYDFSLKNGGVGSLFLVTQVNPLVDFARKFFPVLFISLMIILVLTHTFLTYFVSKSIIVPLQALRKAAKHIKDGNLNMPVQVAGRDEIGQLGIAFEEMRLQLHESIATQLQYEENRKDLISNISHDLKTPLTAIKGYVEGIQDGIADTPEKMDKYVNTIYSKAEEMDHLIDELFLYSKLDLKRLPFHFKSVDFLTFLNDCADDLRFDLEKKGFRFDKEILLERDTKVWIDLDKMKRAIINIVENGVKYSDKFPKFIRFRAYEEEGRAILEIADNGQGIEPGALSHIFERFYRAEESRNSHTGGSGLGLAIAKQIVEGHEGSIQAFSKPGEGTSILIALPIRSNGSR